MEVMFHFEKVRFDQCLRALFRMFRIFWEKREGGEGYMTLGNRSTTYRSMEEAIAELREVLPLLELGKSLAESGRGPSCPPEFYRNICRALELLHDERLLAERLAAGRRKDGSVAFSFDLEAWRLLHDAGGLG
jgi:hypothetical protein